MTASTLKTETPSTTTKPKPTHLDVHRLTAEQLGVYGADTGATQEFTDSKTGVRYGIDREDGRTALTIVLPPKTGFISDSEMKLDTRDPGITKHTAYFRRQNWSPAHIIRSMIAGESPFQIRYFNPTDLPRRLVLVSQKAVIGLDLAKMQGEAMALRESFAGASFQKDEKSWTGQNKFEVPKVGWTMKWYPFFKTISGDDIFRQTIRTNMKSPEESWAKQRSNIAFITTDGAVRVHPIAPKNDADPYGHVAYSPHNAGYHTSSGGVSRNASLQLGKIFSAIFHKEGGGVCYTKLTNTYRDSVGSFITHEPRQKPLALATPANDRS
mgnify:CR=1 FL=1